TLMGLGMFFGFIAFYDPSQPWAQNRVFDLMVQRTYGAMTNDVLISIPLFVLMGYVMERGALVDKMFYSIQLAFRRMPASLAAAMFPGFFLAFLYLVYVIGWALINPKIAPPLPEEQTRVKVPAWITKFETLYSPNIFVALLKALVSPAQAGHLEIDGKPMTYW